MRVVVLERKPDEASTTEDVNDEVDAESVDGGGSDGVSSEGEKTPVAERIQVIVTKIFSLELQLIPQLQP